MRPATGVVPLRSVTLIEVTWPAVIVDGVAALSISVSANDGGGVTVIGKDGEVAGV